MKRRTSKIISFSLIVISIAVILPVGFYFISISKINSEFNRQYNSEKDVSLRKFPYPFKAALAICSDIDNTRTLDEFLEIQKFLNTKEETKMGQGVGLEIGNSFFMWEPPAGAISYFNGDDEIRETIRDYIHAGVIDCIHSFGKKEDFTRQDAIVALKELRKHNLYVYVWVDHTCTDDNLGDDVTCGKGDHPESAAYHSDLTLDYGIKFVWLGRVTMITGQTVPISPGTFLSIYNAEHPQNSIINIGKEFLKHFLACFGNKKYALHKGNDLVKVTKLDDGQKIYEFIRHDNHWQGVGVGADAAGLGHVLSEKNLNRLVKVKGYSIIYTHFGRNFDDIEYIPQNTRDALRLLEKEYRSGNIYVTTTSKLLNYYINHKYLQWDYEKAGEELRINIESIKDPIFGTHTPSLEELQGFTFYIPKSEKTRIYIQDKELTNIKRNKEDITGRESVMIPLKKWPAQDAPGSVVLSNALQQESEF